MATRKSTPVIVIGAAVFVIGVALAFLLLRGHNHKAKSASSPTTVVAAPVTSSSAGAGATPTVPTLVIPAGKDAVPVQIATLQGLDGFAKTGDLINIYAVVHNGRASGLPPPAVKLIQSNIEVLAVLSGASSPAPTGTAVYMLALDPLAAEQVIFFSTNESLYFTLVPKGTPPAGTPGRTYQNAF